jgi:hypothetical protein
MDWAWTCRCCGKQFNTMPLDYACPVPGPWSDASDAERAAGRIDSDLCRLGEHRFIRGCLEIPIIGTEENLVFGVWTSLSQASFQRVVETWTDAAGEGLSYFGWFCNELPAALYPPTHGLKCRVHLRGVTARPRIELEPTDHPLAVEQRLGIDVARVEAIAAVLLPKH